MNFEQTISVVTGAGRGIGRSVALELAREGSTVILVARTESELRKVQAEIKQSGGKADCFVADITDDKRVAELFEYVKEKYGRLDVLINNAGIGRFAPVRNLGVGDFDAMWNLNVRALFLCSQHAVRIMESQKSGIIVQVASLAGKNAFLNGAGYAATKWAVLGFSKCMMLEVREHNIKVVIVCPGSVDTGFSQRTRDASSEKMLSPRDVADSVMAALRLPPQAMMSEIDLRPTNPK